MRDTAPRPPVTGGTHSLPFEKLSPNDFERLCLGLARREGYEALEHEGASGQDEGCDIVAFRNGERVVFQCKRYPHLTPAQAEATLDKILDLTETERPARFVLVVAGTVSKEARRRLRARAGTIAIEIWDRTTLDDRVSSHPDLVGRFFLISSAFQQSGKARNSDASGVSNVPAPPPHYLPRQQDLNSLKAHLLASGTSRLGITAARQAVGVQGMGGIGKSVLAAALAADAEVQAAFPDGVFWVALGQQPDLVRLQLELAETIGDTKLVLDSPRLGKLALFRLLRERQILLVLDDVWELDSATALDVVGPRGRLLITTRNAEILVGLGAEEHRVGLLAPDQALALLADWSGQPTGDLPSEARRVAHECGYLPLALAMIGAMVRLRPTGWADALARLKQADLEKIQRNFPGYPYPDLLRALEISVKALPRADRERYLELAALPEETAVPESVFETLWAPAGLSALDTRDLAAKLLARSLAQRDGDGRVRLHDLQLDYIRHEIDDLTQLHGKWIDAYAARCPQGFDQGPNDGYFFQRLTFHLHGAGRLAELRKLLLDFRWLEAKLKVTGVHALITEYDFLPADPEFRLIQGALRLSSHILIEQPEELLAQLLGRLLMSQNEPAIAEFLETTRPPRVRAWLRPLTASLTPPGGPLVRVLAGHSARVIAVAALPDGRVASAAADGTLRVWDLSSGQILKTLKVDEVAASGVTTMAVLIDGRVVFASYGGALYVWDLASERPLQTVKVPHGVTKVAVLPDGRVVSASSHGGTLYVWDPATGLLLQTRQGPQHRFSAMVVLPDGRVVSASYDGILCVWDLASGQTIKAMEGHLREVTAVAVLPDSRVVSASHDHTLRVWDLTSGQTVKILEGLSNEVTAVAVLPDCRVVSASSDRTLQVWDLESGRILNTMEGHSNGITAVAVLLDSRVVSASSDHSLRVWDPSVKQTLKTLEAHSYGISAVAVLPNGRIVTASLDHTLRVWDLASKKILKTLKGHSSGVRAVAVIPDGRIVSASSDRTLRVWDLSSERTLKTLEGHWNGVTALAVLPDGRVVSTSEDGTVRLWDLNSGRALTILKGYSGGVNAVAVLRDGRIVSASDDCTLRVWDIASGRPLKTLRGHSRRVTAVTVLPDGRAVSASDDCTLRVWDLASRRTRIQTLKILEGHSNGVNAVGVLPDGAVVSASDDRTLRVWDSTSGSLRARLTLDAPATALAVLPDRSELVVGDSLGHPHFVCLEPGISQ